MIIPVPIRLLNVRGNSGYQDWDVQGVSSPLAAIRRDFLYFIELARRTLLLILDRESDIRV